MRQRRIDEQEAAGFVDRIEADRRVLDQVGEFLVVGSDVFLDLALGGDDLDAPGHVVAEPRQPVGEHRQDLALALGGQDGDVAVRLAALAPAHARSARATRARVASNARRSRITLSGSGSSPNRRRKALLANLTAPDAVHHLAAAMGGVQAGFQQVGDIAAAPRDQRQHQGQHRDRDQQADLPRPGHTLASLCRAATVRITPWSATPAARYTRCMNKTPISQPGSIIAESAVPAPSPKSLTDAGASA